MQRPSTESKRGLCYGISAYFCWGLVPIYFKSVGFVSDLEILAHRVIWSVVLLFLLIHFRNRWSEVRAACADHRTLLSLLCSTSLIAANWFVFIWAMSHNQVLQGSLGYYINPLVNILLAFVVLGERLSKAQWISVLLASIGVGWLTLTAGQVPWVALTLALTFGVYGLIRKTAKVGSLVGLAMETALLWPMAVGYGVYLWSAGHGQFGSSADASLLLVMAGAVTAVPLLLFAAGARRLRYTTVGFLQYIAPSMQFLLAVFAYDETFGSAHFVCFGLIWAALLVYTIDAVRPHRYWASSCAEV